jgi:hypothetical protein
MPRRDADNAADDRMDDETKGTEEIRGVAGEGEDEFEETEDLDEEEEEDEGTF